MITKIPAFLIKWVSSIYLGKTIMNKNINPDIICITKTITDALGTSSSCINGQAFRIGNIT